MKYIKRFESHGGSERDIVEKYWELNPEDLRDIFLSLSDTYGTHGFDTGFYITMNGEEQCNIFWYNGKVYKEGPWRHNLEDIVAGARRGYNAIEPSVEVWLDKPNGFDRLAFERELMDMISDSGLPYSLRHVIDDGTDVFVRLDYDGLTELYGSGSIDESVVPDPLAFVSQHWNVDAYEFRDIVTSTLDGFDEYDFELKFTIVYKSNRYHLVEFLDGKLVWCKKLTYDIKTYLDLIEDAPDDVEFHISLILPIERDKDNSDYVRSICQEFDERLAIWGSDWRPKDIVDILRDHNYLTMIGFLPTAKSGYIKKVNPFFRKKK